MQEQPVPERLHPVERTHIGAVSVNLKKVMKDCFLWEGSHAGAGQEQKTEEAAEMKPDELTTTPFIPHLPVTWRGGGSISSSQSG